MFAKEFQDEAEGLVDLLEYDCIKANGIMLGKGGQLIAGFLVRGHDQDSASNAQLVQLSLRLNALLTRFGSGWMTHSDIVRYEAIGYPFTSHFSHPLAAMVDEERRRGYEAQGRNYESMYGVVITYLPPPQAESKLMAALFESSYDISSKQQSLESKLIERFNTQIEEIGRDLALVYEAGVQRLMQVVVPGKNGAPARKFDQLVEYFHFCVTGIKQVIALPDDVDMTVDTLIGSQDFPGGNKPRIGKNHIRVVSIEGFPLESWATILSPLDQLQMQYRWSSRMIYFEPEEGRNTLDGIRKKWRQKVRGWTDQYKGTTHGPVDENAQLMERNAQTAMGDAASGLVRYGHFTSVVVLMSEDEAEVDYNAGEVLKLLRGLGFPGRIESVNAVEAYLGSLPGHGYENVRRPIINTANLSHFLPITALWQGLEYNPCPFYPPKSSPLMCVATTGSTPFRFSFHVQDVGHTFVGGPNGAGKSTFLNLTSIQHLRYAGAKIRGFEKGLASYVACNAAGGAYYDLGTGSEDIGFCPLLRVDDPGERAWAEDFLEMCLALQSVKLNPGSRGALRDALMQLSKNPPVERTMTHLTSALQDEHLRQALEPYTLKGGNPLLDQTSDSFSFKQWTMFEIGDLMEMGKHRLIPTMLYIFRQIERDLDGSPTLIPIDEGWLMLTEPVIMEWLKKWLKTLRKANAAVIFTTQNISDVGNSAIADVVFTNCLTKIYLADAEAVNKESKERYMARGFNERQVELLARAVPKRDYYYVSPLGKRMFQLGLHPGSLGLTVVGSGSKEEIAKAKDLMSKHGDRWFVQWLRDLGMKTQAEELDKRLEAIL